jgi:hypothetical protein
MDEDTQNTPEPENTAPTEEGTAYEMGREGEGGPPPPDREPHHELNNPVGDPDPTEWPDPYEKREDPLDPPDPDGEPFGEEPHPPTNARSSSQPHPDADIEAIKANPPERDKLDQ